jgi:hypothetical protein
MQIDPVDANLVRDMEKENRIFSDTPVEVEEIALAIYRRMPAWRKVELVGDAIRTARHLAMVGLRSRYPNDPLSQLRRRLLGLVLGEEVATAIYGPLEDDASRTS